MEFAEDIPEVDIDRDTEFFLKWTIEKYHNEVNWKQVHGEFEKTADLVRSLIEACVDAQTLGSIEFKAICHATNDRLNKSTLQGYIREFDLNESTKRTLIESVPDSFGVVGGPTMDVTVASAEAEKALLSAFTVLLSESSSEEELLDSVNEIADAETAGAKTGRLSPVLSLLWPELFPIVNGRTRDGLKKFFSLSVSDSLADYRKEIPKYVAVREQFGFRNHFRDLDRFCHWALEGEGDEVARWFKQNRIENRTVWQINAGVSSEGEPEALWPLWKDQGICSLGWNSADLTGLSDDEIEQQAADWEGEEVAAYYKRLSREMEPGQIVIAKDGYDILGIGVTLEGGYQYCGDFVESKTGVHHPHVWPVDWAVTPDSPQSTSDWDLTTNLLSRTALRRTTAFEQLRLVLTQKRPDLLQGLSELERLVSDPPTASLSEICNQKENDPSFYWVNQGNKAERDGEYLRSSDKYYTRDLTKLRPGDILVHYWDGAVRAHSVVQTEAYQISGTELEAGDDEETYWRVDVDLTYFDTVRDFETIAPVLRRDDVKQGREKYAVNAAGVQSWYLCNLTEVGAKYLIETYPDEPVDTQYFWVNAEATDWQHEDGEVFYGITNSAGERRRNQAAYEDARPGDQVLVYRISPVKQVVGQAIVTQGLHEEAASDSTTESTKGITLRWNKSIDGAQWSDIQNDESLSESKLVESDNSFIITELTKGEYDRILELGDIERFEDFADELSISTEDITVDRGNLYFPDEEWERIKRRIEQALANGNHVLLFGPPGTGKTKLARQVCEATVGEDASELVTASADWSTFDTVGGYQTTASNTLEFKPGVVLDRFQSDDEVTPANEWLIIDELNRADIDKAFGSLFSALTGESVTLPFDDAEGEPIEILDASRSDEEIGPNRFFIPEDWRMLATINTLDKTSLYEMSYAFMRRWAFIPVGIPDLPSRKDGDDSELESLVADYVSVWAANGGVPEADQHYETVGRIWRAVNEQQAIGPAIVEDIYEHVAASSSVEGADYVSPIIMYVFPQLEGLRRDELQGVIEGLDEIVEDESGELWTVARDFFQVNLNQNGESS
ncbi:AAA family ATPase [Halorubrum ezzemoulense]|uniref:AAA family ATPase n=1 Tax=Halorubrum ezzemoulense TaxID=337243 RepID=UPI00232A8366|nr:AAA family ATPase [Halorubrum ezzemoulense]MDB2239154.1 AAA family ATPase [Halorubrum ezzemoulense]